MSKWDSLINLYGSATFKNASIIPDCSVINANSLIENIDLSFKLREESPLGKKISFEKFYEFVLPYRFNHEPFEQLRLYFYNQYKTKLDSINAVSYYQVAGAMNKIIPV
jgi:hypothetical protein